MPPAGRHRQRPRRIVVDARDALRLIAQLKPQQRLVLLLRDTGHSYKAICELTGPTYTAVVWGRCVRSGMRVMTHSGSRGVTPACRLHEGRLEGAGTRDRVGRIQQRRPGPPIPAWGSGWAAAARCAA
jgi:hypothetical protein